MSGHEENSMKEAGGCAAGFTGRFFNFNSDAEARLAEALMTVGRYVQGESGCLLGHIKAAVYVEDGKGITLNLIDMDNGVEHHGVMDRADEVKFNFMCAVLDVDEYDLTHKMLHAIDDSGIDYSIDRSSLEGGHHEHEHGEGECDDPDCDCHHHHHDGEECHCHDHEHEHHHEHGEGCSCGHHHHDEGECDDPDCDCHKHRHSLASMIDENGHFSHHHHDHDEHEHHHEHGEGCCCGHHHDHEGHEHHHEHGEECHCHDHDHEHHDGKCCCGHDHDEPKKEKKKGFFARLFGKKD